MAYSVPAERQLKDGPIMQGLTVSSATALLDVGRTVTSDDGKVFQYVYMESSAVACYPGAPAVWVDTTADYVVTPDLSDAAGTNAAGGSGGFAGVFTNSQVDVSNAYLWIQTKGLVDSALVSAVVAVNDALIPEAENCFDDITTYTTSITSTNWRVVGHALTAAAAGASGVHSTASIMLL